MLPRALAIFCASIALPITATAQHSTVGGVALRVLSHQALVRSALAENVPPERRVSQMGVELTLPTPWHLLRAEGRLLRSNRGTVELRSVDAGLVLAARAVGVAAAFGQRGSYDPESGLAHTRDAEFARVGLRVRLAEPHSSFILHLRGDGYVPLKPAERSADELSGWDAEGGVTWRAKAHPYTASLGYRLERFRIFTVDQEVSALTFALGVAFGAR